MYNVAIGGETISDELILGIIASESEAGSQRTSDFNSVVTLQTVRDEVNKLLMMGDYPPEPNKMRATSALEEYLSERTQMDVSEAHIVSSAIRNLIAVAIARDQNPALKRLVFFVPGYKGRPSGRTSRRGKDGNDRKGKKRE